MSRRWWLPVLAGLILAGVALRTAFSAPVPVYSYVTSWGTTGAGAGQFNAPQGVAVDATGNVWVADTGNNRLQRFTSLDTSPAHAFVSQVTSAGSPATAFSGPRGVVVDPTGNVWVSDTGNNRLVKLSPSLAYLLQIKPGTGWKTNRVNAPNQMTVANGYAWETDPPYNRVQQFSSSTGGFSRSYTQTSLRSPYAAAFDASGTYCYVSSGATYNNVIRFKYSGGKLGSGAVFVGSNTAGSTNGRFKGPRGVAVYKGSLFVADSGNNRVQVFNASTGAYITQFGGTGSAPGQLSNPTGLAIDSFGRIYVADTGNNRIEVFYADQTPPVTSSNAPAPWTSTSPVSVSLTATDPVPGTGVAATYYKVDGGTAATYTAPLAFSKEGTTTLQYWSVDRAGNVEAANTSLVRIDTGKPSSACNAPGGWQTSPVGLTVTATDAVSGVAATYCRLNAGATTTYTAPVPISAEGTDTLEYWSVDRAGNVEATRSAIVRIDLTAPVSTDDAPASWLNTASVSVALGRTDTVSGVALTRYAVNGGATATYTAPITTTSEGTTTIAYWSRDVAGNTETTKTAYVRIDRTPPSGSMSVDYGDTYTATTTVSVCSAVNDISPMQMRVDAGTGYGSWMPYAAVASVVTTSADGTKTVTAQYKDAAGNVTTIADTIVLNVTAPDGTMLIDGGAAYTGSTVCSIASDVARAADMCVDPATGTYGGWFPYAATVTTTLPSGDGAKAVRVRYRSGTGLVVTREGTIVLDTTAPTGTVTLCGGAAATATRTVTVDSSVWDLSPMRMRVNTGTGFGSWAAYSASVTTAVPAGDGTKTVSVEYQDGVGHVLALSDTIRLDTLAPTTTDNAPGGWLRAPANVTLTPVDAGSGVAATLYSLNGGSVTTYTAPVLVAAEGANVLRYWSVDDAGNVEPARTATLTMDLSAPVTTDDAPLEWQSDSPITVTLSGSDAVSGLATTYYRLNGGAAGVCTGPIDVTDDGDNVLAYWSVDVAGNVEATKTAHVRIDTVPPTTLDDAPLGWSNADVPVTLTATDTGSGVDSSYYILDGEDVSLYGGPVTVSGEGTHTLECWSVDVAGNVEESHIATVQIDLTPPVTTDNAPSAWQAARPVSVTLTAADAISGVAATYCRINGGTTATYTAPLSISAEGTTTLTYWSVDNAGNAEATKTAAVRIDTTAPSGVMALNDGDAYTGSTAVSVDSTVTDASGAMTMRIDSGTGYGGWIAYAPSVATTLTSGDGTKTVTVQYRDAAGNVLTLSDAIKLDTTAPAGTIALDAGAAYTATASASIDATVARAVDMRIDAGGGYGAWTAYAASTPVTLPSGDGTKTVSVQFRGATGITVTLSDEIVLDTTAPTGTMAVAGGAANTATRTVAVNSAMSDLSPLQMRIDAGAGYGTWAAYAPATTAQLAAGDGTKTVTVQYRDAAGNAATRSDTIVLDTTAPVTTSDAPATWRNGAVSVTLTPSDALSGVAATYYRLDGGATIPYGTPVIVSGEGTHTLQYWSADNAGNVEATKAATVRIDMTAPATADDAPAGWRASRPVNVTLTSADGASGVKATYYKANGGATATYTAGVPVPLSSEGTNTLQYWSVDNAGNAEATKTATVRIDTVAPTTSDNAPSAWQRAAASVTLTRSDTTSGVKATYYRVNGGATATYTAPVSISAEGTNTLSYWSVDNAGNAEATKTATVRIDLSAPVTANDAPASWQGTAAAVTLTATDATSGVKATYYRVNGGATATYTTPVSISAEGTNTLAFWSVDNAGNTEATKTATVRIDLTAPASSNNAPVAWQRGATAVTLVATDAASGVNATYYRLKGGATATYTAPVSISAEGTNTLSYWSVDNAGNAEATKTATVRIDLSAPVTANDAPASWQGTAAAVTLTATDATSGVKATYYRVNGGATATYTAPVSISAEGTNTLAFWSVDNAGNTEATKTATVRIDLTAPVTTDDAPTSWRSTPVTVTLRPADPLSGVSTTYWSLGGSAPSTYTGPILVSGEGYDTLAYWSVDRAGNVETTRSATIRIDSTPPAGTMTVDGGDSYTGTTTVTIDSQVTDMSSLTMRVDGGGGYGPWVAYAASTQATITSGDGTKTVTVQYADAAGNVLTLSNVIRLDASAPAGTLMVAGGAAYVSTQTVSLASAVVRAVDMRVDSGSGYGAWAPYAADTTAGLPCGDGPKSVRVQYRGATGLAVTLTSALVLDTAPPAATLELSGGRTYATTRSVSIESTASDVSPIHMRVDSGAGFGGWTSYSPTVSATLQGSDGTKTVRVEYRDAVDLVTSLADTIVLDLDPPVTSAAISTSTASANITLSASDAGGGVAWTRYRLDGGAETSGTAVSTSVSGSHTLTYRSADRAGNVEATKTATFSIRGALAWTEVAGKTRYDTALAISQQAFPTGSGTVIMATGLNHPDALGGGALAGAYDCPILLVPGTGTSIPASVTLEIERLKASKVVILGSNLAVSDAIAMAVGKIPGVTSVQRIGGKTRYDTADLIAREAVKQLGLHGKPFGGKAFVMTGGNFPDALVASPIAFRLGRPLLLVPPSGLTSGTSAVIADTGVSSVTIVDSGRYVPASVDGTLAARMGAGNVMRIDATGAPAISVAVSAYAESQGMSFDNCGIATSQNFPDALAGGPLQAHDNAVLLLTPTASLDSGVSSALNARKARISRVKYFGSPLAVSQAVRNAVQSLLK